MPGVANYFIGNDPAQWHTNVPTSARVRYTDLYPGIDLTVYGTEGGGVEYDALVAPGADPAAFALAISGAEAVTFDEATGDLVLTHPRRGGTAARAGGVSGGERGAGAGSGAL